MPAPKALGKTTGLPKQTRSQTTKQLLETMLGLLRQKRYEEALPGLSKLVSLTPQSEAARYHHAHALFHAGQREEAHAAMRKLLRLNPDNPDYRALNAAILFKIGQNRQAREIVEGLLTDDPRNTQMLELLTQILRRAHDLAGARAVLTRALEIDPYKSGLHYHHALHGGAAPSDAMLAQLENQLDDQDLSADERSLAGFALGNYACNAGDDAVAFRFFERANRLLYRTRSANVPSPTQAWKMWGGKGLDRAYYQARANWGLPDPLRLFIIGGSRAGKSLVETLAALHPSVVAGGEQVEFLRQIKHHAGPGIPDVQAYFDRLNRNQCKRDARYVREKVSSFNDKFLTNTLPDNIWTLPIISLWFPKTPIIFCRRNIIDQQISIFFKKYESKSRDFFDYGLIGNYLDDINRLMDFYLETLPNPMLEVNYEDNVRDPGAAARKIYGFLGLETPQGLEAGIHRADKALIANPADSIDGLPVISDHLVGIGARFSRFATDPARLIGKAMKT